MSFDFMQELEFLTSSEKQTGDIRAALHLAERVVATQTGMGEKREKFSIFHEIAHCVLPEHNLKLFMDNDQTLSWWTKARLEREANRFAADLLFQGRFFTDQALSLPISIESAVELAPQFGASYEATLRRYTEGHVMPCALIVYDKLAKNDESFIEDDEYTVQYVVTSSPFRKSYFSAIQMSGDKCTASEIYSPSSRPGIGKIARKDLVVDSKENARWRFQTEVFSNGYKIFQFLKRPLPPSPKE